MARLAQHELGRVLAFSEHIRVCANKFEVGVNFRINAPNYDRVVEMSALVAALNLAFPEYRDPSLYPWPGMERKMLPGSGWSPSPRPPTISYRDPGDDIKEFLAKADAASAADKSRASFGPEMVQAMTHVGHYGHGRGKKHHKKAWGTGLEDGEIDTATGDARYGPKPPQHDVDGEAGGPRAVRPLHASFSVRPASASRSQAGPQLQQTASGRFNSMTSPEPGSMAANIQYGQPVQSAQILASGKHCPPRPQSAGAGTYHGMTTHSAGSNKSGFSISTHDGSPVPSRGIASNIPRALSHGHISRPGSGGRMNAVPSPLTLTSTSMQRPHSASVGSVRAASASYRNLPARRVEVQATYSVSAASMQGLMGRVASGQSLSEMLGKGGGGGDDSPNGSAGGSRSQSRLGGSFVRDLPRMAYPEVAGLDPMPMKP